MLHGIPLNAAHNYTGNFFSLLNSYSLARVLLADFPVVILGEPAEHLDDDTARDLASDLLAATEGRTRLLITHRPVDAAEVDQIVRLDGTPPDGTPRQTAAAARAFVPTGPLPAVV